MTQAIILAAGQGTRLRPYTDDRPKCLVELAGRPLLAWQLQTLQSAGIQDITVIGGYRADQLQALAPKVVVNEAFERTNMVSSLFVADTLIREGDGDLLILYGDIVYERAVLDSLLGGEGDLVVAVDLEWQRFWSLRMEDPLQDAETLRLGEDGRIVELGKKPRTLAEVEGQYIGAIRVPASKRAAFSDFWHALDRSALYDGKTFDNMFMTSFIQSLIDADWRVMPAYIRNGWLEVDTVTDLDEYNAMAADGSLAPFCRLGQ